MNILQTDIQYVPGIGPKRASILNTELDIFTLEDLLRYYPYRYVDRSRLYYVHEVEGSMPYVQLKGKITAFETFGEGRKRRLVAHFTDGTGFIDLVWFQGIRFVESKYKRNKEYIVFGKPSQFGNKYNIAHPDIEECDTPDFRPEGLMAFYNTSDKMKRSYINSKTLNTMMEGALGMLKERIPESLSPNVVDAVNLISLHDALENIHFPKNPILLRDAEFRLKFEELFFIQLNILRYSADRKEKLKGFVFTKVGDYLHSFYKKHLPFELTNAQKRVIREIRTDTASGKQMNRLLQGDVGSGKTLVALMLMLIALDNGFQSCMMAPTEILASQHFITFKETLSDMDVNVALLTG